MPVKKKVPTKRVAPQKRAVAAPSKPAPQHRPKVAKAKSPQVNGDPGRNMLENIDWSKTEGWNPRPDSAVDIMFEALQHYKGDRQQALDYILETYPGKELIEYKFVGPAKRDGTKRTAKEQRDYLSYRIARTAWDFAIKTGQHTKSENRKPYTRSENGAVAEEAPTTPAKKRGRPPKPKVPASPRKRIRS